MHTRSATHQWLIGPCHIVHGEAFDVLKPKIGPLCGIVIVDNLPLQHHLDVVGAGSFVHRSQPPHGDSETKTAISRLVVHANERACNSRAPFFGCGHVHLTPFSWWRPVRQVLAK